jgi:hypothetical protein
MPLGWLVGNGFLENRSGELSWHTSPDLWLIGVLVVAAVGLAAARGTGSCATCAGDGYARRKRAAMADVAFVLLTVVLFGALALVVRAVEKL